MTWEFWIERHPKSGRRRIGENCRRAQTAEGKREPETRNWGELWKWRRCGNGGNPTTDSHRSHSVLEISRKAARFPPSHSSCGLFIAQPNHPGERTGCGGKVEIQKQDSHFPAAPMACGARKKILKVSTMRPVRFVYHAPVLTHTRVNAGHPDSPTMAQRVACENRT